MKRRAVVTGLGVVTPLGIGRDAFAENLFDGKSGIGPVEGFETITSVSRLAAQVRDFVPTEFISGRNLRRMDRLSQMVTASAKMALTDAGLDPLIVDLHRTGIVMGTAFGATDVVTRFATTLFTEGPRRVNPILVPNTVMNAPAGHAAIELGLKGINTTFNHREASAEAAIAYGAMQIQLGRVDVVLTGGGDILSPFFLSVLERFCALSPQNGGREGARPFDVDRNGPVAGEGVGVLCMETAESARRRDAPVYCEIDGWAMGGAPAPANDWPEDPSAMVATMGSAMAMAGVDGKQVDFVSAAANGGIRSDRLEAAALDRIFSGEQVPLVTSTKGGLGENFASGGIRAVAMALSIQRGAVPPTIGLDRPITALPIVKHRSRKQVINHGLVNACASGGTFVTLSFKKFF